MFNIKRTLHFYGLAAALTLPAAGGAATAAIAADNVISGCYNKTNGQLRIVVSGNACLNSELPISWNQGGAQGPQGLQGPKGDPGPAGSGGSSTVYALIVKKVGAGAGTVTSPQGIECGEDCTEVLPAGTFVKFDVTANAGSVVPAGAPAPFTISSDTIVTVDFEQGTGACDSSAQTQHTNGLGQSFYDCTPLSTYNEQQATEAAHAWAGSVQTTVASCTDGSQALVAHAYGSTAVWAYSGRSTGYVHLSEGSDAHCPSAALGDPQWD